MTYKLVDVRYNTMWLLDDEIVIIERATPNTVYFKDWINSGKESASLDFFLANAEYIAEDSSEYNKKIQASNSWWYKHGRGEDSDFEGKAMHYCGDKEGLVLSHSGKKVGELLNDDVVVVIVTDGSYKGGHTTKVRYELADFMDDEPPFMEVLFVDKHDDVVYFTEDMNQPVYGMNGMYIVKGE